MIAQVLRRVFNWVPLATSSESKVVSYPQRFIITECCVNAITECLRPSLENRHECVAYLLGRFADDVSLIVSAVRPHAYTTHGSFHVDSVGMAHVVRTAANLNLHIVGQVHTHPGEAYHSDGDDEGAPISYPGFLSIVIPKFGIYLPSFQASASYMRTEKEEFVRIANRQINIISTLQIQS